MAALALSAALPACFFDNEEDLYEFYYEANQCDTVDITWTTHIEPVIRGKCSITGCHVAGGTGNGIFESYENVKVKALDGSLMQRTVTDQDMPPSGPLSSCQMEQIAAWVAAGAPEN